MEELLKQLPPYLNDPDHENEKFFLTVATTDTPKLWVAFYGHPDGWIMRAFKAHGRTPKKALTKLKVTTDLLKVGSLN